MARRKRQGQEQQQEQESLINMPFDSLIYHLGVSVN